MPLPTPRSRGVSLIEALVALAVMAFGMLSLAGVQSTMRLNNDLAKQRTEATRIATEEMEQVRVFLAVAPIAGQPGFSWDEIGSRNVAAYQPPGAIGNTTYSITRTVNPPAGAPAAITLPGSSKVVTIQVQWTDRTGTVQTVTLDGMVAGVAPALSSLLSAPLVPSATNQTGGRQSSIPRDAVDLRDGFSAFKPFNTGTVVWVFNNLTGQIVSRCAGVGVAQVAITRADLVNCAAVDGRRLAGVVQFDLGAAPLSESPSGPILPLSAGTPVLFDTAGISPVSQASPAVCVANSPQRSADAAVRTVQGFAVAYECVVFPSDAGGWGGKLDVVLANQYANGDALPGNTVATDYKVCRYTQAGTDYTRNADHPRSYCMETAGVASRAVPCTGRKVTGNLVDQNFLVVNQARACPADNAGTPLINGNTLQHQP